MFMRFKLSFIKLFASNNFFNLFIHWFAFISTFKLVHSVPLTWTIFVHCLFLTRVHWFSFIVLFIVRSLLFILLFYRSLTFVHFKFSFTFGYFLVHWLSFTNFRSLQNVHWLSFNLTLYRSLTFVHWIPFIPFFISFMGFR
jgi:hypothetical protein